ncbi:hypothetical protein Tco_1076264 [Tanacetum coccineum]
MCLLNIILCSHYGHLSLQATRAQMTRLRMIQLMIMLVTIQEPTSEYDQALKNVLDKMMDQEKEATKQSDAIRKEFEARYDSQLLQEKITRASSTNSFNTISTPVNTASTSRTFSPVGPSSRPSFVPFGGSFPINVANLPHDPLMPELEDTAKIQSTGIFGNAYDDHDLETLNTPYADQSVGAGADFNNMEPSTVASPIPTTRVQSIHPKAQIIRDPNNARGAASVQDSEGWDTKIPQSGGAPIKVGDEAVHKELGDRMERAATTASSLELEQDSGNINRTQSMATLIEPSP